MLFPWKLRGTILKSFGILFLLMALPGCAGELALPNLTIQPLLRGLPAAAPIPVTGLAGKASARAGSLISQSNLARSNSSVPAANGQRSSSAAILTNSIRNVGETVRPAVVQIVTQQNADSSSGPSSPSSQGIGSGVIFDSRGYVLTNNHVIDGAEKIMISLPDRRAFEGKLVGADPLTDLAVLQIPGENLPFAKLGDSSSLGVGDWVVAIGNAFGLPGGPTVSAGVISATGRSVQEPSDPGAISNAPFLYDLLQTDAPINPGNSGGPLVSLTGEVIGINTLILGQVEPGLQAQGIGFAISASTAKPIAEQLIASGHVVHPYLGIAFKLLSGLAANRLGIQQTQGVMIVDVSGGSPAEKAGLRPGDIITRIENQSLLAELDLSNIVEMFKPGDTIRLTVNRDGQTMEIKLILGEAYP